MCFFLFAPANRDPSRLQHLRLVVLALAQLVLVAATGLLPGETARVWSFMFPLLMMPVGLELARWPMKARIACLTMLALITASGPATPGARDEGR